MQDAYALHPFLKAVEPLPGHSVLSRARAAQAHLRKKIKVSDDFLSFAKRAATMPPALRTHSLTLLRGSFNARKEEIQHDFHSTAPDKRCVLLLFLRTPHRKICTHQVIFHADVSNTLPGIQLLHSAGCNELKKVFLH